MNASLLKHIKTRTNDIKCIDDHIHVCVVQVVSADAIFVLKFEGISEPYEINQVSGKARKMTSSEIALAKAFAADFVYAATSESLLDDDLNTAIAKAVTRVLGQDDFFKYMVLAKALMMDTNYNAMLQSVSSFTGIDIDSPNGLVRGVVVEVQRLLSDAMTENR